MQAIRDILRRVFTTRAAWPILICVALLSAVSLNALEVASPERFAKQQVWIGVGLVVVLVALLPHYNVLGALSYFLYGLSLVLLVAVFFAKEVKDTHRWFVLPGGVQLQPSELAKISFVLALGWYLRYRQDLQRLGGLVVPFVMAFVPFVLIFKEPDLGTALIFPVTLYAMLLAAGANLRYLTIIAVLALAAVPAAYPFLRTYQQDRIKSLLVEISGKENEEHLNGKGRQVFVSKAVVSSGGAAGNAEVGEGTVRLGLLPAASTDFIFAVVGMQHGFLGCLLILLFYVGFFAAGMEIAATSRDMYGRLLTVGLVCVILFQATMNISMTIGLMPVVGISLPFVSYGGSSLLVSFLAVGLLLNVSVRRFVKRM